MRHRPDMQGAITRRDDGFGLTEMLVSLALLALISLLVLQGIGTGQTLWQRLATRDEAMVDVLGAQTALRTRLEKLFPATRRELQLSYPDLDGTDSSLVFLGPADAAHSPDALRRYRLHVDAAGDLVLESRSDLWGNMHLAVVPPPMEEVLLRHVGRLSISYFEGTGGAGNWQASWRRHPGIPALVRLQVSFPPGDRRWWPVFLVHPVISIDDGCLLNTGTGNCGGRQS